MIALYLDDDVDNGCIVQASAKYDTALFLETYGQTDRPILGFG